MNRPAIGHLAFDTGPVPHFVPAPPPEPPAPAPGDALADIAAGLDALHQRASLAARDERMHPLGVRDRARLHQLLPALRHEATGHPCPLPALAEPPPGRALSLPDLLPYLAPARQFAAQLGHRRAALARLQARPAAPPANGSDLHPGEVIPADSACPILPLVPSHSGGVETNGSRGDGWGAGSRSRPG